MQSVARTPKQMGEIIRRIRRDSHLSQKDLGERAGLWQETISKIENESSGTKLETLFDLLAALDLELVIQPRGKSNTSTLEDIF